METGGPVGCVCQFQDGGHRSGTVSGELVSGLEDERELLEESEDWSSAGSIVNPSSCRSFVEVVIAGSEEAALSSGMRSGVLSRTTTSSVSRTLEAFG